MTRSRAERHMNTLPLRMNMVEFAGHPPATFLITRVDGRPGAHGDWVLYITLEYPPVDARGGSYPTAYFPVPAADLIYTFPEDSEAPAISQRAAVGVPCAAGV